MTQIHFGSDYDSFWADPYACYRRLRDDAPVYYDAALGYWALSRHEHVELALKDWARFSNRDGISLGMTAASAEKLSFLLAMDPPRHQKMRSIVSNLFTPRRIADLEPAIRKIARGLIAEFLAAGEADFAADFATRLPMDVISEMLGVPQADRERVCSWADDLASGDSANPAKIKAGGRALGKLWAYFEALVEELRSQPAHNELLSQMMRAERDEDRLDNEEFVSFMILLTIAGAETTANLLSNMLYWAHRFPDELDKVRGDASRIPAWIEETLRYDSSTQFVFRTTREDVTLEGTKIPEGARIALILASANRDERVFEAPDRYDLDRRGVEHLGFGKGIHFCMGSVLARLEARVAMEEIFGAIPDLRLLEERVVRKEASQVRGFDSLPISFSPKRQSLPGVLRE